jgi:hypothetical protein
LNPTNNTRPWVLSIQSGFTFGGGTADRNGLFAP